jgi:hypothetical protein
MISMRFIMSATLLFRSGAGRDRIGKVGPAKIYAFENAAERHQPPAGGIADGDMAAAIVETGMMKAGNAHIGYP